MDVLVDVVVRFCDVEVDEEERGVKREGVELEEEVVEGFEKPLEFEEFDEVVSPFFSSTRFQ